MPRRPPLRKPPLRRSSRHPEHAGSRRQPWDGAKPVPPSAAPAEPLTQEQNDRLRTELAELSNRLKALQGEKPLMQVCVDSQAIAEVVSGWTGIPVGPDGHRRDPHRALAQAAHGGADRRPVARPGGDRQRIRTSRANLTDPRRPIGVFLLVGPSGVGKTETAITLAELLYGGDQNMTVINMSEFKEEHKVSLLMGSPPGYVGYGEGGVLTEAVRRRPYSVVLLDEMEKAHPGVQDIFYQVFDKGTLRDGEGRDIDFKNTVILMTSNAGTDLIMKLCADPETCPDPAALAEALHPELLKTFKPAFLGRVTLVPYFPLSDTVMRRIVELQLGRIRAGWRRTTGRSSPTIRSWWPGSPAAAPRWTAGPATWTTSSPGPCCRRCRPSSSPGWRRRSRSARSGSRWVRRGGSGMSFRKGLGIGDGSHGTRRITTEARRSRRRTKRMGGACRAGFSCGGQPPTTLLANQTQL